MSIDRDALEEWPRPIDPPPVQISGSKVILGLAVVCFCVGIIVGAFGWYWPWIDSAGLALIALALLVS